MVNRPLVTGAWLGLHLVACGGAGGTARVAPPDPCDAHQDARTGCADAVPPGAKPSTPETAAAPAKTEPQIIATTIPGPAAQPLDALQAAAAAQVLEPLSQPVLPPKARPVGPVLGGHFLPGQSLARTVELAPGKCYTVVAAALPPAAAARVSLLVAPAAAGVPAPVIAVSADHGGASVLGRAPDCFRAAAPLPLTVNVLLEVPDSEGVAVARIYESDP